MRTQLVIGVAAGAFGALVLACSSSSSSDPYASVGDFCTAYAKAICQISSTCQFDASACQTYQSTQCSLNATQATSSGSRQYKSGNVQPCIDALNNAYGNNASSVSVSTLTDINNKCQHVFEGSAGHGSACQSSHDCTQSGDVCATAPGVGSVCATPTQKNDGDFCADPGDQCPSSDFCQPTTGTSKCVPAASSGQACSTSMPCDGNDHCVNGTCQSLAKVGGPCGTSSDCSSGLMCDTYTSATVQPACVDKLTFARGSVDCIGIEGQSATPTDGGGPAVNDAGGIDGGGSDAPTSD
jgi:hypothetical protein